MSATSCFRRLLTIAGITALLLGLAVTTPLLAGQLLSGSMQPVESPDRGALLSCLFVPTAADWQAHLLSYMLAGLLSLGIALGVYALLRQWYRTYRTVRTFLRFTVGVERRAKLAAGGLQLLPAAVQAAVDLVDVEQPVAFCYGWVRPRICISRGALQGLHPHEVEALVLHEYHHLLSRDPLKTAISRVLASTFFFLPAVRALQEQYMLAKELEADQFALNVQSSDRPLLGALYKMLLKQVDACKTEGLGVAGASEAVNLRLDYLLDGRRPAGPGFVVIFSSSAILTVITGIVVFTTWTTAANALWYQAHSGMGGC